ncbi:GNAT family N-acetyltransferase [Lacticaseibacillus sp. GG6-2]
MMIRLATTKDTAAIAALYTQLTAEMAALAPDVIKPLDQPATAYFHDYLQEPNAAIWVVEEAQQLVGFSLAVVAATSNEPEVVYHRFAYCIDLFIDATWRRHGFATALMAKAFQWGQDHDCEFLQLNVLGADTGARRFYEALGFLPQQLTLTKSLNQA